MSDITRDFVDKIQELCDRGKFVEIDGIKYMVMPAGLKPLAPMTPEPLTASTLQALVDYLQDNPDNLEMKEVIVQVVSPIEVRVLSTLFEVYQNRDAFLHVKAILGMQEHKYDRYMALEPFIIMLQTQFVESPTVQDLLKLLGNITDENVRMYSDDGVTQGVTARVGVVKAANVPVPNPVDLAPYRSFPEVEQVKSRFVFRMSPGEPGKQPGCALFLADGDRWKPHQIAKVAEFLKAKLPEDVVILS